MAENRLSSQVGRRISLASYFDVPVILEEAVISPAEAVRPSSGRIRRRGVAAKLAVTERRGLLIEPA